MKPQHKTIVIIFSIVLMVIVSALTVAAVVFLQNSKEKQNIDPDPNFVISETSPTDYTELNKAVIENGKIEYFNAGSSSCPPIAEKVEYNSSIDTYTIFVKKYGNQMCTADLRGFSQTIEYEDGTIISSDSIVEII